MKNVKCRIKTRMQSVPNRFLRSSFFILTRAFGLVLMTLLVLGPSLVRAESHRWLLIVDTSRAMRDRTNGAVQVAGVLVNSGMNGQARRGDSLGIWTFNEALYAGRFPLQQLSPENGQRTAQEVMGFLLNQKYEKESHLEKVVPELTRVVTNSELISIILITDGLSKIHGTPFDDKINASFQNWQPEQKKRQMPFVTLLRGVHGKLTDFVVGTPPWPMDFPQLPPEPKPVEVKKPEPPKPPILPPLILSGKQSEAAPLTNAPGPVPEKTAPTATTNDVVPPQSTPAPMSKPPENPKPEAMTPKIEPVKTATASPAEAQKPIATETHAAPSPAVAQTAVGVPGEAISRKRPMWPIALTIAGGLLMIILMIRRVRNSPPASLITRSLDREQK
jgi:hypothetical protein